MSDNNIPATMIPCALFNAKLLEFMNDLILAYPEESEFVVCADLLKWSLSCDQTFPQKVFNEHIASKYEKFLLDKNEEFFLTESYDPTVTDIRFVEKLKQMWKGMDTDNKQVVWKYMQCLLVLNRKCQ
jgi:hypothetical protein